MTWLRRVIPLLVVGAACGSPAAHPADAGADAARADAAGDAAADATADAPQSPCPSCELLALDPAIAATGDTITLEGTFVDSAVVTFPGGATADATLLGPHRATVVVPAAATAGPLTVATGGITVGPLAFRRATFALGLQSFAPLDQVNGARQDPALVTARDAASAVAIGPWVYVIGGGSLAHLATVERARIDADGGLGTFSVVPGVELADGRAGLTTVVIGDFLYVIGGYDGAGETASLERARIAPNGDLGPFVTVTGVSLTVPRALHTSTIVGDTLYVIGGLGGVLLTSVEQATIHADGSLGPFTLVADRELTSPRAQHTSTVIGASLYVVGGGFGTFATDTVERADIAPDGTLGPFALVTGVKLVQGRAGQSSAIVGDALYVVGGYTEDNVDVTTIERATIQSDGTLATFTAVPGGIARTQQASVLIGTSLYVFGGYDDAAGANLTTVERASLDAGGALGAFGSGADTTIARGLGTSAVLGDSLYLVGGFVEADVTSADDVVKRASVAADGALGTFAPVAGVAMVDTRVAHSSAVIGDALYVIGGLDHNHVLASVERAPIAADGTLGTFATAAVTLTAPRNGHTSIVSGGRLYVIGGETGFIANPLASVESAPIAADGTLGAFTVEPDISLVTARTFHTTVVVRGFVYVIGGVDSSLAATATIERAPIAADGTLGTFAVVSGVTLATPRGLHASAFVGSSLFVLGGGSGNDALPTFERAPIAADGTLGTFAAVPDIALAKGVAGPEVAVLGNHLVVIGGTDESALGVEQCELQ